MADLASFSLLEVAPYAGAWIEIFQGLNVSVTCLVAPYAGAWIEISVSFISSMASMSLPTRERGLK